MEGVAVYISDQMGTSFYPSKNETYNYIRKGNFLPPAWFKTGKEDQVKLDVKYRITFMYSEFACIVDYLIEKYGVEKFLKYMNNLTRNPDNTRVFRQIYDIDSEMINFRNTIINQH